MRARYETIEFAKELFLTPNEAGGHKYSLRAIAREIAQQRHKSVSYRTIARWSKKYGWDKLWERGIKEGITKAIAEEIRTIKEDQRTKEELFRDAIAKKAHDDFAIASDLKELAYSYIKSKGFSSVSEALKAIEIGFKYTSDLSRLTDQDSLQEILAKLFKAKKIIQDEEFNDVGNG